MSNFKVGDKIYWFEYLDRIYEKHESIYLKNIILGNGKIRAIIDHCYVTEDGSDIGCNVYFDEAYKTKEEALKDLTKLIFDLEQEHD